MRGGSSSFVRGGLILRGRMKYYGKYRGELGSANAQQCLIRIMRRGHHSSPS